MRQQLTRPEGGNAPRGRWWLFGTPAPDVHPAQLDGAGILPGLMVGLRSMAAAPESTQATPPGWFDATRAPRGEWVPIPVAFLNNMTGKRMRQDVPLIGPRDTTTSSAQALQATLANQLRGVLAAG